MRNERITKAGNRKATQAQVQYIRELAVRAGYEGDTGYNAANDLLGDGRGWSGSVERASAVIDALKRKLCEV